MLPIRAFAEDVDVMFATERGTVKKTALSDYKNINCNGIRALNIDEGDKLMQVRLTHTGDDVLLITANGQAMRFNEAQVRRMGRTATGVRGIRLAADDVVRSFDVVDNNATLLVATENGYGKRTDFQGFTPHHRGGKGMIAIKDDSGRNGKVVAAHAVKDEQSVIMITSSGMMVRSPVSDIRVCGRSAQGVRLVRMDEGTTLVSASIADAEEVVDVPVPLATSDTSPETPEAEAPTDTTEPTE
jgi:DNA gyrase subunit A